MIFRICFSRSKPLNKLPFSTIRSSSNWVKESSTELGDPQEVILSHVPNGASHSDIRGLCFKKQFESVDVQVHRTVKLDAAKRLSLIRSILSIRFLTGGYLNETGKVSVHFRSLEKANLFIFLAHKSILGGSKIEASLTTNPLAKHNNQAWENVRILRAMQDVSPGRTVLIKGLPEHMTSARLEKIIQSTYQLSKVKSKHNFVHGDKSGKSDELGPVVQLFHFTPTPFTSTFLVRFRYVNEAMRFVAKWHRTPWIRSSDEHRQLLQRSINRLNNDEKEEVKSWNAFLQVQEDMLKDGEGEDKPFKEEENEDDDQPLLPGHDQEKFKTPLIIDARIMY